MPDTQVIRPYRPNKWLPAELASSVVEYFETRITEAKPFAWSGLAVYCGISREGLDNYAKGEYGKTPEDKKAYVDTLKWARSIIEAQREGELLRTTGQVAGVIFALKNHHGWRDDRYLTVDTTETHQLVVQLPPELANALETRMDSGVQPDKGELIEGEYAPVKGDPDQPG